MAARCMIKQIILLSVFFLTILLYTEESLALSCREGSNASSSTPTGLVLQSFPIGSVAFAQSDFTAGTILWRSQNFTATFTCWDTNNYPRGEDVYIYWNPKGDLSKVNSSLSVGVTIDGTNYDGINLAAGVKGPNMGPGTKSNGSNKATPLTITFTFSIYIKATGVKPPPAFTDIGTARVFQVDGVLGLNGTEGSNYNAQLTNFNNITILQCTPTVTITGTSNNTIDFGSIMKETSAVGKIAKTVPFTITADVSGGGCKGQQLAISVSSANVSSTDSTLLIPSTKPGVGIFIVDKKSAATLSLGTVYNFTDTTLNSNIQQASRDYTANLKWLTNNPTTGSFSTTAIVSITFK